jgi:hypothetical protein
MIERHRFPLNVDGDFYVEDNGCMACAAPEAEAPDLMAFVEKPGVGWHCYFKKQPSTPDEIERAVMAIRVGCCAAVRYCGDDPMILLHLANAGVADACDRTNLTEP